MGDHVGKKVKVKTAVAAAPAGHVGAIQGIHHEAFYSVGVGSGVAYVPASYLDSDYDSDVLDNDMGEMDDAPTGVGGPNVSAVPAIAHITPDAVLAMFVDWRRRGHR